MANSAPHFKQITCENIEKIKAVAGEIISFADEHLTWLYKGEMGAGKTTLISAVCDQLGVQDHVSSPTFSIVNEYLTENLQTIYHFDFYRIKDEEEAIDIGINDYFYSGNYSFIEWPSKIQSLIPERHLEVSIQIIGTEERLIDLIKNG